MSGAMVEKVDLSSTLKKLKKKFFFVVLDFQKLILKKEELFLIQ